MSKRIKSIRKVKSVRHILPLLAAKITRHHRYLPKLDFNWRGNVCHSLLMCHYFLFGRKTGIQHGPLSWYQDSTGVRKVWIHSTFGVFMFLEHEVIRPFFRKRIVIKPIQVFIPAFAVFDPWGFSRQIRSPFLFSIAFEEGEGSNSGTGTSLSLANVEGSGSDRWLSAQYNWGGSGSISSTSFGGSSINIIAAQVNTSDGTNNIWSGGQINPTTSSGSLTASISQSAFWVVLATTYSGVDQTTATANESSNAGASPYDPGSPLTFASTSDKSGSWQWASCKEDSAANAIVATTGQLRQSFLSGGKAINALLDGNLNVASGANGNVTITWTSGGQRLGYQMCMIRPSVADVSATGGFFLFL